MWKGLLNVQSPLNAYKRNQIYTASPGDLVLMLYDGGRQFIRKGIRALQSGEVSVAHANLLRAQDILSELMAGLNFAAGPIARDLYTLYEYMRYQLIQANLHKDSQPAQEALALLDDLRDTWARVRPEQSAAEELNTPKKVQTG